MGLSEKDWMEEEEDGDDEEGDMGGGKEEVGPQHGKGSAGPVDDPQHDDVEGADPQQEPLVVALVLRALQPHEPPGRQRHFETGRVSAVDDDDDDGEEEQHDAVVGAGEGEIGFGRSCF